LAILGSLIGTDGNFGIGNHRDRVENGWAAA
jgi:hypothetical protein